MKVAFFAHDAGLFGAQRTLLTLLQHLDRRRFDPLVFVPGPGQFVDEVRSLEISLAVTDIVRWVPSTADAVQFGRRYWIERFFYGLRGRTTLVEGLLRQHGVDLVYTNTVVAAEGALASWRCGIPHLWHIHEPLVGNPELRALFPTPLYSLAVNALSDSVVFCSRSLAQAYPSLVKRAHVVFNGLPESEPVDRATSRRSVRLEFGLPAQCAVVAVVGAIQPRKDHATFLRAARRLAASRSDIRFLIVGGDVTGGAAELRRQISEFGLDDVVRLVGWWQGSIHQLLAGVDLLAVSSIQESFGLTVIEAFAVETPVVSTRCGGPEEVIRDGVDGYLVPVGDDRGLADQLLRLLNRPDQRAAFGRAGRDNFRSRFTVNAYVAQLQAHMADTAARRRSSMLRKLGWMP